MTAHLIDAVSMLRLPIRLGRIEPHPIELKVENHQLLTVRRRLARAAIWLSRNMAALT